MLTMTSVETDVLFRPIEVKSLKLPNRIVMAPMTRGFATGGIPGAAHVDYYRRRAEGGVGLILTEGAVVERPASRNEPGIPYIYGKALDGWRQVVEAVHTAGGKIAPQIWHVGAVESKAVAGFEPEGVPESPSGLVMPGVQRGKAMSEEDVADTISAFAQAALNAKNLGFDCIELHGAHGYLIDQFFWEGTNLRTDRYGGRTLPERSRFAIELVRTVRQAVGEDFPILFRISQWKQQDFTARLAHTPQEMEAWLGPLADAGVDIFHCSQRRFWEAEFPEIDGENGLNCAGWVKNLTGAVTISVGSVGQTGDFVNVFTEARSMPARIDQLLHRMERDEFDMIAIGRALIAQPDWPQLVRRGEFDELKPFEISMLGEFV